MQRCAIGRPNPTPTLAETLRRRRKGKVDPSWYLDETYIRVRGRWRYLYRAIDRDGALVDVMLSEHRELAAARAFFRSAKAVTGVTPDRVTTDGHDAYPRAIRTELGKHVRHWTSRYPNNRLEQDHRGIKSRLDRCLDRRALYQRHATAAAMTNFETSCAADPVCANMFPPQCGAGGICGKPRLSSLSWRQLERWRRWREFAELNGAKTDRATSEASTGIPDTTLLQRLNGEIKRRTDVVGIFPNEASMDVPTMLPILSGGPCCDATP